MKVSILPLSKSLSKGFTLLEVLIAMAILAFAFAALLGHQSVAIQSSDYSNRVSQASFLLQSKLLDVKHKILTESIDLYDQCDSGDFKSDGFRGKQNRYRWKVCTFKIEMQEGAGEQLTERFASLLMGFSGEGMSALGGGGGLGGGMGNNGMGNGMEKAMGQIAMATGMIPRFLQQLEDQIRKVRIQVSWKDQINTRKLVIERFVTSLGADAPKGGPPPEDNLANDNKNVIEDAMINAGQPPIGVQ
jgi:prepilin-type N-terminal cleavage/methylation domain-containing protein